MKGITCLLAALCAGHANAATNPITKVMQMLSDLQSKIISEGNQAQKIYQEFSEWCEDRSTTLSQEISTGKGEAATLQATISKETATIEAMNAKIEELASNLAVDEADLKAATGIRAKESSVFAATEKDLSETIDMLTRASRIVESEMAKGGASMMQVGNMNTLTQAFSALVSASAISSADAAKLESFAQQGSDDDEVGAPAGAIYSSQSGGILATLDDLREKAQEQLDDARKKETSDTHNFELLKQSIEDEIAYASKEMAEAKKNLAASAEAKATAKGELSSTSKELAADKQAKADLHHECMTKAQDFEAETKSRGEELNALAEGKKALEENTGAATSFSYGQASLLQVARSKLHSGADLAGAAVVRLVAELARKQKSSDLSLLAQRIESSIGADQFGKVKGLIRDMIQKLETEADEDATEKSYCDTQLADTREKKATKAAEIEKLTTRIDAMSTRSAQLKEEIAALQAALAKLAAAQSAMDKLRAEEKAAYDVNKADLEKGLEGVKMALEVLSEYYSSEGKAHNAAMGAGVGIIGLLEVIESDFSKNLAQVNSDEEAAQNLYEQETKDNEIEKTTKEQDVKYKTKESKELDSAVSELSGDRSTVQTELDAVLEYLSKIEERCIAKAETFAARAARFAAEISGLKEALRLLEEETALVQRGSVRRHLRKHS